ncbi:hypothetical protein [Acinetobacter sp. NIPH 2100]|uniref:hypothetical protein n=1 Tax=Acinetobacter sp. NIPH 2100 TaxID=1217708 RepID=UPI0002CE2C89|nr:hypothetical protein [Acinetobacter sp. NIPH 2100]ENX41724.1 hypothetical protein F887_02120 [Acinetobacter sp. NIPH 2100]
MMNKNISIILSCIALMMGCSKGYKIEPNELPNARVGQPYHQSLIITGGKVVDKYFHLKTDLPNDVGVVIEPSNELDGYNNINIKGTPKYSGNFSIEISTGFYGKGDDELSKTYDFIISE